MKLPKHKKLTPIQKAHYKAQEKRIASLGYNALLIYNNPFTSVTATIYSKRYEEIHRH